MTTTRREIIELLAAMSERYPEWRFGQMVANVSFWALGPTAQAVWEVADDQFLEAVRKHLEVR